MRDLVRRAQMSGQPQLSLQANVHSLRWTGGDKTVGNNYEKATDKDKMMKEAQDRNKRTKKRQEQRKNNKYKEKQTSEQ
jgi:hypothetical protein